MSIVLQEIFLDVTHLDLVAEELIDYLNANIRRPNTKVRHIRMTPIQANNIGLVVGHQYTNHLTTSQAMFGGIPVILVQLQAPQLRGLTADRVVVDESNKIDLDSLAKGMPKEPAIFLTPDHYEKLWRELNEGSKTKTKKSKKVQEKQVRQPRRGKHVPVWED